MGTAQKAIAEATPVATPPAATVFSPQGVPLQPFLASAPAPAAAAPGGGSWKTYATGELPGGKFIEPSDANQLANRGLGGDRIYMRGKFVVTASGGSRAVLRSNASFPALGNLIKDGAGAVRIIVDYPAGSPPPAEGEAFARDESRPFQITDIRRGSDGQINVYAREVVSR